MRVVSLLPAATEILYGLDLAPVGVSHECDHPPSAETLPAVTRPGIDPDGTTAAINEQVARAEEDGGVYDVDDDLLARLDPDLIVTQRVCDVCAVDRVQANSVVQELGLDTDVVTMDVHTLEDLFTTIERLGAATDRRETAASLVEMLRDRVDDVTDRAAEAERQPRVAVLDWTDPIMVAGHWVPELVERAGGRYGLESAGSHSRPREWREIRSADPEVLVVAPCGFDLAQTRATLADLTDRPGWDDLTAVRNDRTWIVDGHNYVNRPGPRLVDTLEVLAGIVQPVLFERPPTSLGRRI